MSVTLPGRREIARHESYHGASLLLDDLTPLMVRLDLWDDEPLIGNVRIDWEHAGPANPDTLRKVLVSILMGPLSGYEPQLRTDHWPIQPSEWQEGNGRDGEMAAYLVERLGFGVVEWGAVIFAAEQRAKDPKLQEACGCGPARRSSGPVRSTNTSCGRSAPESFPRRSKCGRRS